MNEDRLAPGIRDAFQSRHMPSPGLEDRVIMAMLWDRKPRARRLLRLTGGASAVLALGAVVLFATTYGAAADTAGRAEPITQSEAIADAMKQLPNGGTGYRVLEAQLEPSSKHFEFVGPNGMELGEDQVQECLVIPPIPRLPLFTVCRYYPVWVVAFSSPTCNADVAINAYTGRFAGGGSGSGTASFEQCQLVPESPTITWFQPTWA